MSKNNANTNIIIDKKSLDLLSSNTDNIANIELKKAIDILYNVQQKIENSTLYIGYEKSWDYFAKLTFDQYKYKDSNGEDKNMTLSIFITTESEHKDSIWFCLNPKEENENKHLYNKKIELIRKAFSNKFYQVWPMPRANAKATI